MKVRCKIDYLFENQIVTVKMPEVLQRMLHIKTERKILILTPDPKLFHSVVLNNPKVILRPLCPCGYFSTRYRKCTCSLQSIEKHYRNLLKHYSNCLVYEDTGITWRFLEFNNIDVCCIVLLKSFYCELKVIPSTIIDVVSLAQEIAQTDKQDMNTKIRPEHIAEAISYFKLARL